MKNKIPVLFLFPVFCFSQQAIKGKIKIETPEISGILVVNLNNETETETDGFGKFSIQAGIGDLLIFSASHIHKKRHLVEEADFAKEIEIEIETLPYEIEAVEIARSNITSESLGIVPKGQKRYTTAERRLYTSQSGGVLGSLIDIVSGRLRMLKILLEMEKEDKKVEYLSGLFREEFFTENLNLEPHNIMEFKYFSVHLIEKELGKDLPETSCGEEEKSYLRSLSKEQIEMILITLANEYSALKNEAQPEKRE